MVFEMVEQKQRRDELIRLGIMPEWAAMGFADPEAFVAFRDEMRETLDAETEKVLSEMVYLEESEIKRLVNSLEP